MILVIAVLVFAMTVFGGPSGNTSAEPKDPGSAGVPKPTPTGSAAQPPATTDPAEEPSTPEPSETTDKPEGKATTVASPSGNIECNISEKSATCTIASLAKKPKKNKACDGYIGYVYTVTAAGVEAPCVAKADLPKAAGGGAKVLAYGKSVTEFGFTCVSAESGMGCALDESEKGFKLSQAGAQTF